MNNTLFITETYVNNREKENYKHFFFVYCSCILVVLLLVLLSLLFLWRLHEFSSYDQIVSYQIKNNAIYGPGTIVDYFEYKLKIIEKIKPKTVVLGSSRALGFQSAYINTNFVNAGLAMRSFDEGTLFIEEMLKHHIPERIIITLDFWWFNEATPPYTPTYKQFDKSSISSEKILLPYQLIAEKKLSLNQFLAMALFAHNRNSLTNYQNIGIIGLISSNGNRADGSMLYAKYALEGCTDLDPKFSHTAEMINKGTGNYQYGRHIYTPSLKKLENIIQICNKKNIKVYFVIPPIAPAVKKMMISSPNYHYIDELRAYLNHLDVPVFDFHDASKIPATDCEFIDGYHSGDITYIKMLLKMAESSKIKDFSSIVNITKAKETVRKFDGNIIDRSDSQYFPQQLEKDFLLLGCQKK